MIGVYLVFICYCGLAYFDWCLLILVVVFVCCFVCVCDCGVKLVYSYSLVLVLVLVLFVKWLYGVVSFGCIFVCFVVGFPVGDVRLFGCLLIIVWVRVACVLIAC